MQIETISLEETDCFSKTFLDYVSGKEELAPFYGFRPEIQNFESAICAKNFPSEKRELLMEVLSGQYEGIETSFSVSNNIGLLQNPKTFTITTGHQLNIFTGPLYFIYKIVTVINTCRELKKVYPNHDFVPVYWMASEDHDFEEINHFYFEGKTLRWDTKQMGAVGRFDPNELIEIVRALPKGAFFFEEAYSKKTLAEAVRHYVNHLFGADGLLVIDADDPRLKKSLIPVIEDDLFVHSAEDLVAKTSSSLASLGHKTQVHARQVNFFYLYQGIRERIERSAEGFHVVNTDIYFSEEEIRNLIKNHPEQFSPNVILRPLYQEIILPNLAYIGGPSELVYWLQLKSVFDHFGIPFPLLMPRNFALVCPAAHKEKWDKTGLSIKYLFADVDHALKKWVSSHFSDHITYQEELNQLKKVEARIKSKALKVDPSLAQHIEAIHASFFKKIGNAEKKILRAEKKKHRDKKSQIESVKNALFPNGTLQERKQNFLHFYLKDPQFIEKLIGAFDPFNYEMYFLYE